MLAGVPTDLGSQLFHQLHKYFARTLSNSTGMGKGGQGGRGEERGGGLGRGGGSVGKGRKRLEGAR